MILMMKLMMKINKMMMMMMMMNLKKPIHILEIKLILMQNSIEWKSVLTCLPFKKDNNGAKKHLSLMITLLIHAKMNIISVDFAVIEMYKTDMIQCMVPAIKPVPLTSISNSNLWQKWNGRSVLIPKVPPKDLPTLDFVINTAMSLRMP